MHAWRFIAILTLLVAITSGCSTRLSRAARQVQTADEGMVASCTLLGVVQGSSGWGNLAASKGINNARNEAQERAVRLGATHIVWTDVAGGHSPSAAARAYKCSGNPVAAKAPETPADSADLEERLAKLKRAFEQGLITKQEYDEKRKALVNQF